jgi:signal transduction histidine kinase
VGDQRGVLARPGRPLRFAAVLIALLAIGASVLAWIGYQTQVGRVVDEAELRAHAAAADVDRYVQSHWHTLNALAAMPAFQSGDPDQIRPLLEDAASREIGFDAGISWVDRDGMMQTRSGGYRGPPIDFTDRLHVRTALASGQPAVSSALIGAVNQAPIVGFVVPTRDAAGEVNGVLGSGIRLGELSMGADNLRYAGGSEVIVVDRLGQVLAGPATVDRLISADPAFPLAEMQAGGEGVYRSATGPLGRQDQLIGYSVTPSAGWVVLAQRPAGEAFGQPTRAFIFALALIAGFAVLAGVVLVWASRRLDDAVAEQSRAYALERSTRQELEAAVAQLERGQELRDAFVGVMSHELRTPVTTIYGAAKLLAKSPRRPELETLIEDIEEEADRLHRITEDLLVLSRAEHGLVEIRPEPVLVQRLVPSVIAEVRRRHPALDVQVDLAPALPPVAGDEAALRQVLVNLLTNAAKYGEGTPVRIVAVATVDRVRLRVEDQGPGLPASDLEPIFDLFYRSEATSKRAAGTGIGLYVVRQLVLAMGGTVHAYPVEPTGLGFLVELQGEPTSELEHAPSDPVARTSRRAAPPAVARGPGIEPRAVDIAGTP